MSVRVAVGSGAALDAAAGGEHWRAPFALARALSSSGEDGAAEAAAGAATGTVRQFAATLAEHRRVRFLAAPSVVEVLEFAS